MLAGGSGTRFWPASRARAPKPFLPLVGERTLIDETLRRLRPLAAPASTWVVSARALAAPTRKALRGHPGVRTLLEPVARDTAAAIAWAAANVARRDPEADVAVFPADHHIPKPAAFHRTVRSARRAAAKRDALVLIGIEPRHPEPAYGYIQLGAREEGAAHRVRRFVEKPDAARARRFVRSGDYLWNAGMVVAPARRILEECRRHAPEVWTALGPALERTASGQKVTAVTLERAYRRVRPLSFDRAVLERTTRRLAVRGRFRWSDVGSWDAIGAELPQVAGNRVGGEGLVIGVNARDNIVWNATDKVVALLGLEGLVVVNTDDALLVCRGSDAQDVRRVVGELRKRRRGDLL